VVRKASGQTALHYRCGTLARASFISRGTERANFGIGNATCSRLRRVARATCVRLGLVCSSTRSAYSSTAKPKYSGFLVSIFRSRVVKLVVYSTILTDNIRLLANRIRVAEHPSHDHVPCTRQGVDHINSNVSSIWPCHETKRIDLPRTRKRLHPTSHIIRLPPNFETPLSGGSLTLVETFGNDAEANLKLVSSTNTSTYIQATKSSYNEHSTCGL
jgi:hypothetical protein